MFVSSRITLTVYFLQQTMDELMKMAFKYYDEIALPELVLFYMFRPQSVYIANDCACCLSICLILLRH